MFGSSSSSKPSIFGNTSSAPTGGLFGTSSQQQQPPQQSQTTSLFGTVTPSQQTGGSLFGPSTTSATPWGSVSTLAKPSLLGGNTGTSFTTPQVSYGFTRGLTSQPGGWTSLAPSNAPFANSAFGSSAQPQSVFSGGGGAFTQQAQQQTQTQAPQGVPLEIQAVLGRLGNADARTCAALVDIYNQLLPLATASPSFLSFTYVREPNRSLRDQLERQVEDALERTPELDKDLSREYLQLKKENPDPSQYYLMPLEGFGALLDRARTQEAEFDALNEHLQAMQQQQQTLRDELESQTIEKLLNVKRRNRALTHKLIRVMGLMEEFAISSRRAQMDQAFMDRLLTESSNLQQELHKSPCGPAKLAELRHSILTLEAQISAKTTANEIFSLIARNALDVDASRGSRSLLPQYDRCATEPALSELTGDTGSTTGDTRDLTESDMYKLLKIFRKQQDLFDALEAEVKDLQKKAAQLQDDIAARGRTTPLRLQYNSLDVL